ncbi:methyl-accepting chemotaxis protein [Clostridiaceae bacterium 35-E11]
MKKITTQIIIILLVFSCVIACFTIFISYDTITKIIKEQALMAGTTSAKYNAERIEAWTVEKAASLKRTTVHIENIYKFDTETIQRMLQNAAEADGSFFSVFIGFDDGQFIDGRGWIPPQDYDVITRPWYREARKENDVIFTRGYIDKNKNKIVNAIAVPIDIQGKKGVLAANIAIDNIIDQVNGIKYGKTGYGMLLDGNGMIISHPNKKYIMKLVEKVLKDENSKIWHTIQKETNGIQTILLEDVEQLMVYTPISSCQWQLILLAPLSEFQDPAKNMLKSLILMLGICFMAIILLGIYVGKAITNPVRKMIASVSNIATGNLLEDIDITSEDELGKLSVALNRMRKNLLNTIQEIQNDSNLIFINAQKLLDVMETEDGKLDHQEKISAVKEEKQPIASPLNSKSQPIMESKENTTEDMHPSQNQIAGTEEVYAIAEQINHIAERLKKEIDLFKI